MPATITLRSRRAIRRDPCSTTSIVPRRHGRNKAAVEHHNANSQQHKFRVCANVVSASPYVQVLDDCMNLLVHMYMYMYMYMRVYMYMYMYGTSSTLQKKIFGEVYLVYFKKCRSTSLQKA